MYCVVAKVPPGICSARYDAVGFGRSPAVISLAFTDRYSDSFARSTRFSRVATPIASSSVRLVSGSSALAGPVPRAATKDRSRTIIQIIHASLR